MNLLSFSNKTPLFLFQKPAVLLYRFKIGILIVPPVEPIVEDMEAFHPIKTIDPYAIAPLPGRRTIFGRDFPSPEIETENIIFEFPSILNINSVRKE